MIGKIQEVNGDGVVGQKPVILPKQTFGYTRPPLAQKLERCGNYEMEYLSGKIYMPGDFSLSIPHVTH